MSEIKGGYGLVSRKILRDPELSAEAKAIYAYLSSFAGSGNTCYPGIELMMKELQMGKDRFYKNMGYLIQAGIIRKSQERNGNRWGRTVYTVNHCPDFEETGIQQTENQDAEYRETGFQDSTTRDINKNSLAINRSSNSNSFEELCVYVCDRINRLKWFAGCKGRVKPNGGGCFLKELIEEGATLAEIKRAADELQEVKKGFGWLDFETYFRKWKSSQ